MQLRRLRRTKRANLHAHQGLTVAELRAYGLGIQSIPCAGCLGTGLPFLASVWWTCMKTRDIKDFGTDLPSLNSQTKVDKQIQHLSTSARISLFFYRCLFVNGVLAW